MKNRKAKVCMNDGGTIPPRPVSPYSLRGMANAIDSVAARFRPPPGYTPAIQEQRAAPAAPVPAPVQGPGTLGDLTLQRSTLQRREAAAGLRDGGDMGGLVPGEGEGDKIDAKYEPGEFVVSNDMIDDNPGLDTALHKIRAASLAARGKTVEEADAETLRMYDEASQGGSHGKEKGLSLASGMDQSLGVAGVRRGLGSVDGLVRRGSTEPVGLRLAAGGNPFAPIVEDLSRRTPPLPTPVQSMGTTLTDMGAAQRAAAQAGPGPHQAAFHGDGRYGAPANPTTTGGPAAPAQTLRTGMSTPIGGAIKNVASSVGSGIKTLGRANTALAAPVAALDTARTSTEDYNTRFGFSNDGVGDGPLANERRLLGDVATRALGFASDVGNAATLGQASRLYRDKEAPTVPGLGNTLVAGDSITAPTLRANPTDMRLANGSQSTAMGPGSIELGGGVRRVDGGSSPLFTNVEGADNDRLMARGSVSAQNQRAMDGIQTRQNAADRAATLRAEADATPQQARIMNLGTLVDETEAIHKNTPSASIMDAGGLTSRQQFQRNMQRDLLTQRSNESKMGDATTRRGQDISSQTATRGQDITARGQDLSNRATLRGQDVTARGQDLDYEGKMAPVRAAQAQRQLMQRIVNQAGGDLDTAREIAVRNGLDPKLLAEHQQTSQSLSEGNVKDARETFKDMFPSADGKGSDKNAEALAHRLASQVVPGWETMDASQRAANRQKVVDATLMVQAQSRLRNNGLLQAIGWDPQMGEYSQMPDLQGSTVGNVGFIEGALKGGGVQGGDIKITLRNGDVRYMPAASVSDSMKALLQRNGAKFTEQK